jgi:RHS repeat-associated protein
MWGYALPDHLGSVRTETDALGQVTVARHFDPFGVPLGVDGGSPFGYTGEWWDAGMGLVFLRARYYDPAVGRFITRDSWLRSHT